MTTFGWKRKVGANISKDISLKFSAESKEEVTSKDFEWIQDFKRKKSCNPENCKIKCEELKAEGVRLAEQHRFHEAVTVWNKALNLIPTDETILEMKAQALLQLNSHFPAIQAAEHAIKINPHWWVAYQTLGRCQLGIGDICMAKRSFAKAIHLNPLERELWDEDLHWTLALIDRKNKLKSEEKDSKDETTAIEAYFVNNVGRILSSGNNSKLCEPSFVQCRNFS